MKNITLDFLINHKRLFRKHMSSFAMSYMVCRYKTKIEFVFDGEGAARCYLHQSDDDSNNFNHNILIGLVRTEDELNTMLNEITERAERFLGYKNNKTIKL